VEKQPIALFQQLKETRFTKQVMYKSNDCTIFILNFLPGQQMPAHYHIGAELFLHVLQGNGTFTYDGRDLEVSKDDVVHCGGTKKLAFTNTGTENVSIYVTLSKVNDENTNSIEKSESC
jgi:quercetin dioxygenase-like cupin family protein